MEQFQRNHLVARIIAGKLLYKKYFVHSPTRELRYLAEEMYAKVYQGGLTEGLHTDLSLLDWMKANAYWTDKEDEVLKGIEVDIDNLKVGLFESGLVLSKSKKIKETLSSAKQKLREFYSKKHRFDHTTASYNAGMAKISYLLRKSVFDLNGISVRLQNIAELLDFYSDSKIPDEDFRELARNEPWLSTYNIGQTSDNLFSCAIVDLTDEQKSLLCWSMLYSNIKRHEECPSDEILNDDDALDGWLIVQKRKQGEGVKKKRIDELLSNEKIKNADEVFVVVNNPDDAKIVNEMNDPLACIRKQSRIEHLKQKEGETAHLDMPDMKQQIQMEFNRMRSK